MSPFHHSGEFESILPETLSQIAMDRVRLPDLVSVRSYAVRIHALRLAVITSFFSLSGSVLAEDVPAVALSQTGISSVLTDRAPDGTLWARGTDWKIRFGKERIHYFPRLGAKAPRNATLDLSLSTVSIGGREVPIARDVAAEVAADVVSYARGPLTEVWHLTPRVVEQTFVIERSLGAGDLVLELGAQSDVTPRGRTSGDDGLLFDAQGVGSLSFSDITIVDAAGRRVMIPSAFEAGRIVLRIPHAVLSRAIYPVVIDPLITNLSVDVDAEDDQDPDVAHGLSHFLVVYESVISASDRDIISRRYDEDGAFKEEIAVDISTQDTVDPAVAASNSNFMIVWNQLADGSLLSDNVIRGRRRIETTGVQAAAFDISTGARDEQDPDVGGTDNLISRPFFVVWTEDPLIGGPETHGRPIDELGNGLGNDVFFGLGNLTDGPHISKSARNAGRYVVIWESSFNPHRFLDAQLVSEGGALLGSLVVVGQNLLNDPFHADIDGDGTRWLVVKEFINSGTIDIEGTVLALNGSNALVEIGNLNLSNADQGVTEFLDQAFPSVASEGCRFTYSYFQEAGSSQREIRTSTIVTSDVTPLQFGFLEKFQLQATVGLTERDIAIATTQFHDAGKALLAWTRDATAANSQIDGALRSTLNPGGVTMVQTGCGSPEPLLLFGGTAPVGGNVQLLIGNVSSTTPLLAIGTQTSIPLCPGQAGCTLGVSPIILTPFPAIVSGSLPCDPALIGFQIAVQAIDILPANATGVFCGPPKFSQKVRVSDTAVLKFQ